MLFIKKSIELIIGSTCVFVSLYVILLLLLFALADKSNESTSGQNNYGYGNRDSNIKFSKYKFYRLKLVYMVGKSKMKQTATYCSTSTTKGSQLLNIN